MKDLTPRQTAILEFVTARIGEEGLPPTLAEIAAAFGFNQVHAAQKHLAALAAKGHLEILPGKARGIRLAGAQLRTRLETLSLPIWGRVAAGAPIGVAAEDNVQQVLVDRTLFTPTPHYLLKVKGDSMRDEGILDGDLIAVHRTPSAENGQIVVARIEDEITVKRLQRHPGRIVLMPRNPDYAPIEVPREVSFAIEGLYCGLVRRA
jgi:repressor LexA